MKRRRSSGRGRAMKRRRRTTRRRARRGRFVNTGLTTTRFVYKDTFAGSDTVPLGGKGYTFELNNTINSGEFQSLFDQYRINRVQFRFIIRRNPDHANTATNKGVYPRMMFQIDKDDATAPSNFAELQQVPTAREIWFTDNKPVTRWMSFKPSVETAMYRTALTTAYGPKRAPWIDMVYPDVPHYGLKFFYDNLYAGIEMLVECRYNMSFRGVR